MKGVLGSFVCDEEGRTLARALPEIYDDEMLAEAGRTAAQTTSRVVDGETARGRASSIFLFSGGRLIFKGLDSACLCILCTPRLNLPLLNLTANVAVKKLQKAISTAKLQPALRGGVRFAAAYPITPATEILEWLAPTS